MLFSPAYAKFFHVNTHTFNAPPPDEVKDPASWALKIDLVGRINYCHHYRCYDIRNCAGR
jgi:hypothetical protein